MTVNTAISNPFTIALIFISGALVKHLLNYYIPTAKNIKHLEGVSKYITYIFRLYVDVCYLSSQ